MGSCYSSGGMQTTVFEPVLSRSLSADRSPSIGKEPSIRRAHFIIDQPGMISDAYALEDVKLGEGSYGSVSRATHKATDMVRAIKTISKERLRTRTPATDRVKREIAIMKLIDHPGIIKLHETFADSKNIYLCMELCTGGELFGRIVQEGRFSESAAAGVMQQVLRSICYMHKHGICHRDLKPENFLLQTKDPLNQNVVKIIDFGLSSQFEIGTPMNTRAGSAVYVAPEVLTGSYDHKCDLWSVGVIMYIMLCGYPPFQGSCDIEVLQKVTMGNLVFRPQDWKNVSEDAKNLITNLMRKTPEGRFSADQAFRHTWIAHKAPRAPAAALEEGLVERLRAFRLRDRFVKAALHAIATQMDGSQIRGLRDVFVSLDSDGDGLLAYSELRRGLQVAGIRVAGADLEEIVDGIDVDGNGEINYTEFLAATLGHQQYAREDVCWCAFNLFDLDRDGQITSKELKNFLEKTSTMSAAELVRKADTNGDGTIDFPEFMAMMQDSVVQAKSVP